MAQKKGGGSTRNGRDSQPKMLGVKVFGGQKVPAGSIIVRQRGTKYTPGRNVIRAEDDTLYAGKNGIVWAAENVTPAVLHAYDAVTLQEIYNSNQAANGGDHYGSANKFITPTIARGKVFVGTSNGVGVFGLLAPAN